MILGSSLPLLFKAASTLAGLWASYSFLLGCHVSLGPHVYPAALERPCYKHIGIHHGWMPSSYPHHMHYCLCKDRLPFVCIMLV